MCNCASSDSERELDRITIMMFSIHKEENYKSCAARGSFNVKMMASQKRDPTWKSGDNARYVKLIVLTLSHAYPKAMTAIFYLHRTNMLHILQMTSSHSKYGCFASRLSVSVPRAKNNCGKTRTSLSGYRLSKRMQMMM